MEFRTNLLPHYRFDNFVEGKSNKAAIAICKVAAENPGKLHNPILLVGGCGLGKTHLGAAVLNCIASRNESAKVHLVSTERLMNELFYCQRNGKENELRDFYYSLDALYLENLQFASGRPQSTEVMARICKHLLDQNRQLIFCADGLEFIPAEFNIVTAQAVTVNLAYPDLRHRHQIIKAKFLGISESDVIADEVIEFLAHYPARNIRECEGLVLRLVALAALGKVPIGLELAKTLMPRA